MQKVAGLYIIEFPPLPGGGGIKGSGDEEGNQRGKNYIVLLLYGEANHRYKNATRRVAGKKIKGRGWKKIKGSGDGEGNLRRKKEKKKEI